MANRFWVGGTGQWDGTTTHWSTTSGGSNGASVPISTDNIVFDGNSGGGIVTTFGSPTTTTIDSATLASASSQSLSLSSTSSTSITGNITYEFWVKLTSAPTSGNEIEFANKNSGAGNNLSYAFSYNNVGGTFKLRMFVSSGGAAGETLDKAVTITVGTWTHVAFSWTASTATCEYMINGVSQGTTTGSNTSIFNGNSPLYIGQTGGSSSFLNAKICQIRLWSINRTAAQVLANYQFQIDSATNLNASWQLNNALTDGSGNANTLTNNNTVTFTTDVPTLLVNNLLFTDGTFTGFTGTLAGSCPCNVAGSFILASGMSITYTGAITFSSTATGKSITSAGQSLLSVIVFNGVNGAWTLTDAFNTSGTFTVTNGTITANGTFTAGVLTLTTGNLMFNNVNVSIPSFSSSNSNTRTISLGTGTISLTSSGTVWNTATTTGLTITQGTSTIKLTDATSSSKTFSGGSLTYYNLYITGSGTGTYTIVGSNTFNDFKCDTPPHTINFTAGTTQTISTFTVNGTAGNLMTLQSTSPGSTWYVSRQTSGTVQCDYLSLQDSTVLF